MTRVLQVQVHKSHLGETVIELPIDMHHRLMKVSGNWHYVDKLYPRIQSFSGKEKVASGVVNMFLFCILNYVRDNFLTPSAYQETCDFIPDWIDALIDDRDVASEAKQLYEAWAKREIAI